MMLGKDEFITSERPNWLYANDSKLKSTQKPVINWPMGPEDQSLLWIPYAIAAAALICIVVLICFFFRRSCRFCSNCCSGRSNNGSVDHEAEMNNQRGGNKLPPPPPPPPKADSSDSSSREYGSRISSSERNEGIHTMEPAIPISVSPPKRQHLVAAAMKQKYIGEILAKGRRPRPAGHVSPVPKFAPSAARQVARTAKIIGDILTYDGHNRRRKK